jgi:hypothetical protein
VIVPRLLPEQARNKSHVLSPPLCCFASRVPQSHRQRIALPRGLLPTSQKKVNRYVECLTRSPPQAAADNSARRVRNRPRAGGRRVGSIRRFYFDKAHGSARRGGKTRRRGARREPAPALVTAGQANRLVAAAGRCMRVDRHPVGRNPAGVRLCRRPQAGRHCAVEAVGQARARAPARPAVQVFRRPLRTA